MDILLDDSATPRHRDYMLSKMYHIDKDLQKLDWTNFLKIFDGNHQTGLLSQDDSDSEVDMDDDEMMTEN